MAGATLKMIFLLSSDLLASNQSRAADLLALFRGAALRRHSLLVVDDPFGSSAAGSSEFDRWMATLTPTLECEMRWLMEILSRIPSTAVTRGATTVAVVDTVPAKLETDRIVVKLVEAVRLATLPLFILVENALSDGAFLRRVLPAAWREKLIEWERSGVVKFEHGGGVGEIKRLVERCSAPSYIDPLGLGHSAWGASHVFISDRDSKNTEAPSPDVNNLKKACEAAKLGKRLHILKRRDQEAYLPPEALRAIAQSKPGDEKKIMIQKIDDYLAEKNRHHKPMPVMGEGKSSWFKGAFLSFEEGIAWDDAWFVRDGSGPEMVDLAEMIAAFL